VNELAIAFAMQCDMSGLTYEQGLEAAERLADEIMAAAEDRSNYLVTTEGES
jgi:ribosomal protein S7